jgi:hypothetical protein
VNFEAKWKNSFYYPVFIGLFFQQCLSYTIEVDFDKIIARDFMKIRCFQEYWVEFLNNYNSLKVLEKTPSATTWKRAWMRCCSGIRV